MIGCRCILVPLPGILARFDLGGGTLAGTLRKQNVVILIALKRWIEIDQIHGLVFDVTPQNIEIVAVIERVHRRCSLLRFTTHLNCQPHTEHTTQGPLTSESPRPPLPGPNRPARGL